MAKFYKAPLAATATALFFAPAMAQEEPEEPRTTWSMTVVDVKDSGMDRYQELLLDHIVPAYTAAGLPEPQLHWVAMSDDWDMMILTQIPGGFATFDSHMPEQRTALFAAFVAQEGSEDAVTALFDEMSALEEETRRIYTHSHP